MSIFESQTYTTRYIVQFVVRRNTEYKKMKTRESNKKGNFKKSKRNRVSYFNIYIVVFAFLLNTIEVGRW